MIHLYAEDGKKGLMTFENGSWNLLDKKNVLPVNDPVMSILPLSNDSALITTNKNGLFILSEAGINKMSSVNDELFKNQRISGATIAGPGRFALATSGNGVYIIDGKGNIIQSFSKNEGLQNNNVLSIFLDRESNVWLGLDNGIDMIAYTSAIKQINPSQQDGAGYTATIHEGRLFIGTSNGLFSVALQPMNDLSFSKGNFTPVENTKGQTWTLAEINNQLLLGHHEGAFVIKNNIAVPISSTPGFWIFLPTSNMFPSLQVIAGTYSGLTLFNYANETFTPSVIIPDFTESSRFLAIDNDDNIWIAHPYRGIYKVNKKADGTYAVTTYTDKQGLPSTLGNFVYKIKNEVIAATEKGIFIFNSNSGNFEPSPYYQKILGDQSIRYMKEDPAGNIWFIHDKTLGVIDLSAKDPTVVYLPELNSKMLSGFEFIYPVDERNIFIGSKKGFFHINYEQYKKNISNLDVQIRSVNIVNQTDSLLFGGYFNGVNDAQVQDSTNIPQISKDWKTIRFEFSSTLYRYQPILEYSYRLKGFDDEWSVWTKRTEKEYTNLQAGNYTFEIKVRNNMGNQLQPRSYSFKVLPPWYKTNWAYLLYFILCATGLYALYKWEKKKFKEQRAKYEKKQKELLYIHELEQSKIEKELIALRNEKLETDISLKNSELASSAMLLVKKGDQFANLKEELNKLLKGVDNPQAAAELKKINKTLNEGDSRDTEWENFAKHFDQVHNNFLVVLKEIHPTITATESKLCAYLRINLSTKEIAQLMNISVRGVEISRYRLRRKLKLPLGANLFDYLISIQTKA
jgi:ligand-binding sensor domain-containing protein